LRIAIAANFGVVRLRNMSAHEPRLLLVLDQLGIATHRGLQCQAGFACAILRGDADSAGARSK
jgi:hypothetical protein